MNIKQYLMGKTLSLNIFDGDPNPNTQTTTLADLSPEMKTYYSRYLIETAEPKLYHDQFGQMKPIPSRSGKSIEFRKYASLPKALKPLVEGKTPDGNNLKVTTVTAEIHQYGDYVTISDILKLTAIDDNIVQTTKLLGAQASRTLDTVTREVLNGTTSVYHAPIVSGGSEVDVSARHLMDATAKITPDCIFVAKTELATVNAVPINNDSYVGIIHPYSSYDLMRNKDEWLPVAMYAKPENYFKGEVGKIGGVRFVETTEAKIFYAEDLCATSRTLTASDSSSNGTISVSQTLVADALVDRYVLIGGDKYKVTANTTGAITVDGTPTVASAAVIYPGEAGATGLPVCSTMILAENAYAVTSVEGGGLEHIYQAPTDPLHQRQTIGWKATKAAVRLNDEYMIRVESVPAKWATKIKAAN